MTDHVVRDFWSGLSSRTPARIALGRAGPGLPTRRVLAFSLAHAQARDAVHARFDAEGVEAAVRALGFDTRRTASAAPDRDTYLRRPDLGRRLSEASRAALAGEGLGPFDLAIVIGDGLSATAIHAQAAGFLGALRPWIAAEGWRTGPVVIAEQARVALGDGIGEALRARAVLVLIGERPGLSSPDSLGLYLTYAPRTGRTDGERNCVSNVRAAGLAHDLAAFKAAWLLREALRRGLTGVPLKDRSEALLLGGRPPMPQVAGSSPPDARKSDTGASNAGKSEEEKPDATGGSGGGERRAADRSRMERPPHGAFVPDMRPFRPTPREEPPMRVVALEEHFTVPRIVAGIDPTAIARRGFPGPDFVWAQTTKRNELADLGGARIADMDAAGITVQVLSVAGPGADLVPGQAGIDLARAYNDALAEACARHPDRYRGFAHLPLLAPEAAADELERSVKHLGFHGVLVNGATDGRFLDDPMYEPLLTRAEALDVPIYLHPGIPAPEVRNAYFDGLPGNFGFTLALSAWGWHADTAIHALRLALSGALDRHPGLRIVIGHMGEALPFMLDRIDETTANEARTRLKRSVRQTLVDQVWITTSGFFTMVPFMAALMSFGVDRILFSVDYPFASNARARAFLDSLPVSPADRARIAHGNADRLLRLPV